MSSTALAAKPEDVFKGRIIITENRLPTRFASEGGKTWRSPSPMPMLEPMHTQQSIAEYGGSTPSA